MSTAPNQDTRSRRAGWTNRRAFLVSFALIVVPVLAKSWPV